MYAVLKNMFTINIPCAKAFHVPRCCEATARSHRREKRTFNKFISHNLSSESPHLLCFAMKSSDMLD